MILRQKDKDTIIRIAKDVFTVPVQILAFGSRVAGNAHEGSDLDLAIKPEKGMEWNEYNRFREALKESNIPILVDVVLWDRIPLSFQQNILQAYEILFCTGNEVKPDHKG